MSTCKWCSNSGFFLFTDKDGLCKKCSFKISVESSSKLRVIKESEKLIEKTKKIDTVISSSELIIKYLSDFLKYEDKGIEVFSRPINSTIEGFCNDTDGEIYSLLQPEYNKHIEKINQLKSLSAKVNQANKFKVTTAKITTYLENRHIKNATLSRKLVVMNADLLKLTGNSNSNT